MDRLDQAGLGENGIRDDHDAACAEATDNVAELFRGVPAENQLAGGVECPGSTHKKLL